ncbi:glucose dehydrogenase [FAD, quinone]-like [Chrysoperla carnea]|uniref:glucose dehydrogenase [FAD, quinone]-like n=1 Tax=Chrysoperla carnea TaxID=189513 RepID=UPI001D070595|nr:glucose dehydrogenase [FAD, quinone]-like [Chrysoperla carnea]
MYVLQVQATINGPKLEYDFIIVGAGSAGCALAHRLSEERQWQILLIEAGGPETPITDIPGAVAEVISPYNSPFLWHDMSEPLRNAGSALNGRSIRCMHGKVMGGTSVVNWMMYTRGNIADYNRWGRITGDLNWSWKNIHPYYKRLENYTIPYPDPNYFGVGGPVHIETPPYYSELSRLALLAAQQDGKPIHNVNGPEQYGISPVQATIQNGMRVSANKAYITPIIETRRNLHIKMKSTVTKILINVGARPLPKAFGVRYMHKNVMRTAYARKEVILCAGPINSPKLLMLSGIGPREELLMHRIPVIKSLPVGNNLFDHVGTGSIQFLTNKPAYPPQDILLYPKKKSGPLSTASFVEAWGYSHPLNDTISIEQIFFLSPMNEMNYKIFNLKKSVFEMVFKPHQFLPGFQVYPILEQPKSRGTVRLRDANPLSKPRINLNYFSDPEDLERLLSGVREAIRIVEKPALKSYAPKLLRTKIPQCAMHIFDTDEYWRCAIRAIPLSLWHFSGTCKMGRREDLSTVLNTRLQVHGIEGLRVVDGSAFPSPVAAHFNALSMMVGEKGADIIKQDLTRRSI